MRSWIWVLLLMGCADPKADVDTGVTPPPSPSASTGETTGSTTTGSTTTGSTTTGSTTTGSTTTTGEATDTGTSTTGTSSTGSTTTSSTPTATGPRTVTFGGREWWVKSGTGGPGPNAWSDSDESVWVDDEGSLHLVIREVEGVWHCAEVYTTEFTEYGVHRFYVDGALDELDANAVFAPFLYANDETEVDIEFTRWGNPDADHNGQYVVQPYSTPGNLETFPASLDGTYTTHAFDWQADAIRFTSLHGHYEEAPSPGFVIHEWLYEGADIPEQAESLRIHINLWLYQGRAPARGEEVSVIVRAADLPAP